MIGIFLKDLMLKWKSILIFIGVIVGVFIAGYLAIKSADIPASLSGLRNILYCVLIMTPLILIFSAKSVSVSTMKSDEIAHWDRYLGTMPVSRWVLVLSKYTPWILLLLISGVIAVIFQNVLLSAEGYSGMRFDLDFFYKLLASITPDSNIDQVITAITPETSMAIIWSFTTLAVMIGAVSMCLGFWFGPKSSKLWSLAAIAIIIIVEILLHFKGLISYIFKLGINGQTSTLLLIMVISVVVSYFLSVLFVSKKSL